MGELENKPSPFKVGQVWEMRFDVSGIDSWIFVLLDPLPPSPTTPRFLTRGDRWLIFVLASDLAQDFPPAGSVTEAGLSDVAFFGDIGYDSYDNEYRRLA